MINKKNLVNEWSIQKEKLKIKFAILTDQDVLFIDGKHDDMLVKLQIKLGKTKQEIKKIISEL